LAPSLSSWTSIYTALRARTADVVRVEVRPREGVARRYDPFEFLDLAKGYIYKALRPASTSSASLTSV